MLVFRNLVSSPGFDGNIKKKTSCVFERVSRRASVEDCDAKHFIGDYAPVARLCAKQDRSFGQLFLALALAVRSMIDNFHGR